MTHVANPVIHTHRRRAPSRRTTGAPARPSTAPPARAQRTPSLGSPRVITAPPGTPEDRLRILREAAIRAVNDKEFVDWATKFGFYMDPQDPAGTWRGLDKQAKIFRGLKPLVDKATGKK